MFREYRWIAVIALLALFPAPGPIAAEEMAEVGDLIRGIADLQGLPATDTESALRSLAGVGFVLPDIDPGKRLTEGDAAAVLSAMGIPVTSSRPEQVMDRQNLGMLLSSLGNGMNPAPQAPAAGAGEDEGPYPRPNENAADPSTKGEKNGTTKGRGKKKGHGDVSPSSPV
jgi:hypothetical protein